MQAAKLFVKSLEAAGVSRIFGVPGEENLALLEAIRKSEAIEFIVTRNEQTAVFMAATSGRLTGRVGVALSTLGPGATNLVTGVAYAQLAGMPLLVITGQKPIKRSKQGKFQIIDVVGMMRPITKLSETVVSAERIPTQIYQAVRTAELERPGAVHLELPEDIADEETDAQPIIWQKLRRPVPDEKSIAAVIEALQVARSPVVILGSSANRKLIRKQFRNFLHKTGIPFMTTQMGKGVEDESSELYLGTTALSDNDYVHRALEVADLIIMIGHDIVEKPPAILEGNQKFIYINFYPAVIDEISKPSIEVVGDISYALWAVAERIEPGNWDFSAMLAYRQRMLEDVRDQSEATTFPIKPQRFVRELREAIPHDGILSLDNGMYKLWVARNYPAYEQNTVLLDNALATMGAGMAVGIAAKLLSPDKKVVVVTGDGGFLMNLGDLETAVRLGVSLVIIVLKDNGYGMIKWKQQSMGLPTFGLDFTNPDFVRLAESFGAHGYSVEASEAFMPTLREALERRGVCIIELPIDYSENVKFDGNVLREKTSRS